MSELLSPPDGGLSCVVSETGRTALVTGAARGIGRAVSEALLANGDTVVGMYCASAEEAMAMAAAHDAFVPLYCDLSDPAGIPRSLAALPGIDYDILVNNAGIKLRTEFFDATPGDWLTTNAVNLHSPYVLAQLLGAQMVARGWGRIINVSSQAVANRTPASIEYGMSKAALEHMTKALARLFAPHGVTVNAISPGRTYSDLTGYANNPDKEQAARDGIPTGRINDTAEVASMVLYLTGVCAGNMTGQVIAIDGGEVIH